MQVLVTGVDDNRALPWLTLDITSDSPEVAYAEQAFRNLAAKVCVKKTSECG